MVFGLKKRRGILLEKNLSLRLIELEADLDRLKKDIGVFNKRVKKEKECFSQSVAEGFLKISNDTLEVKEELSELIKKLKGKELKKLKTLSRKAEKLIWFKENKLNSLEEYCKRVK